MNQSDAPNFCEPWEAQAFAMVVALQDRGLFTAVEWAEALGKQVHAEDAALDGHDYYERWLAALEVLLQAKGVAVPETIDSLAAAWQRAAHATPHGQPIVLGNDPLGAPS